MGNMRQKKKILLIEGDDSKETKEVKKVIKEMGHMCISVKDVTISLKHLVEADGVLASASAKISNMTEVMRISSERCNPYSIGVPKSEGHMAWKKALEDIEFYL